MNYRKYKLHMQQLSSAYHIIINLEVHFPSLEKIPGHTKVEALLANALLIALRSSDQPLKPFQVIPVARPDHEQYLIQEPTVFFEVSLKVSALNLDDCLVR